MNTLAKCLLSVAIVSLLSNCKSAEQVSPIPNKSSSSSQDKGARRVAYCTYNFDPYGYKVIPYFQPERAYGENAVLCSNYNSYPVTLEITGQLQLVRIVQEPDAGTYSWVDSNTLRWTIPPYRSSFINLEFYLEGGQVEVEGFARVRQVAPYTVPFTGEESEFTYWIKGGR